MFNIYKYSLPFRDPFVTGRATFKYREGLILRYHDGQSDLISESAPLPGFSSETLNEVVQVLADKQALLKALFEGNFSKEELHNFLSELKGLPSLQFGVSSLGILLLAERANKSLPDYLGRSLQDRVKVNAVAGTLRADELTEQITNDYHKGFRTIKCKVTDEPGHLPETLATLSKKYSGLRFRLDANRSWPFSEVNHLSEQFTDLPVEFIEEPCRISEVSQFTELHEKCTLPPAADESVTQFGLSTLLDSKNAPNYLVIKPMFTGNLLDFFETITARNDLEDRLIFTTALESIVGRRIVSLLAGMYGSKKTAHGLHTGVLFSDDLMADKRTSDGICHLSKSDNFLISFKNITSSLTEQLF